MGRKTSISFDFRNMLKNIATTRIECTAIFKNKASYYTDYIVLDLIIFLAMNEKKSGNRLKKETFMFVKNIVLTKN